MLRAVIVGVMSVFIAAAAPALLLSPPQMDVPDDRLLLIETIETEESSKYEVNLYTSGQVVRIPLEEYLVGVLVCEMPLSFHSEALKAQAVAARTFAVKQMSGGKHDNYDLCDQSSCCQAWKDPSDLEEKLGDRFFSYVKKAADAVEETSGRLLYYEGELIDAVYFSCSGGATEDAVAVWGSEVPYLKSVNSPGEERAAKYRSSVTYSAEEFCARLGRTDLTGIPEMWFGDETRTEGGGVEEMEIGGIRYSGTDLRTKLELNSTQFSIEFDKGNIIFQVLGYGHRVGMSQYGADVMAENGFGYEEILEYYYQGAEVK